MPVWSLCAGLVPALLVLAALAHGARYAPPLSLTRVDAEAGETHWLVRFEGTLPTRDLARVPLPLHLVILGGGDADHWIRFDLSSGSYVGSLPGVGERVDAEVALQIAASGQPEPSARVLYVGPERIHVLVPRSPPFEHARALVFLVEEIHGQTEVFLSNVLDFDFDDDPS